MPLGDIASFAGWFGAAIWYRRQPEIHKRLMVVATVVLLFAALGRWTFIEPLTRAAVWLSPLFIGMIHDWSTRDRVHPVYILGSITLFLIGFRLFAAGSETWLRIGRPILGAFR